MNQAAQPARRDAAARSIVIVGGIVITGELVGSLASGHEPPIDLRQFDVEHFC